MADILLDFMLESGDTSKMPTMESLNNQHSVVVVSVRNWPVAFPGKLHLETNPYETYGDNDTWEPVLWEDGDPVIFEANGDAVLPACFNKVRMRLVDATDADTIKITLK
jgi:hypothetical protein